MKNINIKKFQKLFIELFYCNLKQKDGVKLEDFKSDGDSSLFDKYFDKYNELTSVIGTLKQANNRKQRLRVFINVKKAVSGIVFSIH